MSFLGMIGKLGREVSAALDGASPRLMNDLHNGDEQRIARHYGGLSHIPYDQRDALIKRQAATREYDPWGNAMANINPFGD